MPQFKIGNKWVGTDYPTYFIADISANHDGDLQRAIALIEMAARSGADCAKFQHFRGDQIASDYGFKNVGKLAHQAGWEESPYDVFKKYTLPWSWTAELKAACDAVGIEFMSTPYDMDSVDHLDPYVNAYKIGSGDITYTSLIKHISYKNKPMILATGASSFMDVARATKYIGGNDVCIMQCNTNYTNSPDNYSNLNLRVLGEYARTFPYAVLGLSDHTTSVTPVLGAVALGARVVERHFTDNSARSGPDHAFSLTPWEWTIMVERVRELESALGDGQKRVMPNETETVVLQRRCLRATRPLKAGDQVGVADVEALRPAPEGSMPPYLLANVLGKYITKDMEAGEEFYEQHIAG